MDADQAPRQVVKPTGIHQLPMELILCIVDYLGIRDTCIFSMCSKSLRASLEYEVYIKVAKLRKELLDVPDLNWRDLVRARKRRAPNLIRYGIKHNWNIDSLERAINASKRIWPCLLEGGDSDLLVRKPPLFLAIEENRVDVVSLLEKNIKNINIQDRDKRFFLHKYADPDFGPGFGLTGLEESLVQYNDCYSAVEVAIEYKNLELVKRFLANPEVPVRPLALCEAMFWYWTPGIEAIVACGRLEKTQITDILSKALFSCASDNRPGRIEHLVSLGADPHWSLPHDNITGEGVPFPYEDEYWNCKLHRQRYCVPHCRTVLSRSFTSGHLENVKKLLEIVPFSEDCIIHLLRQGVVDDDGHLEITKMIFKKVKLNTTVWAESYAAAVRVASGIGCQNKNKRTIRFLLDHGTKLLRSGAKFDLNKPLMDSAETFLEHVLTSTCKRPPRDWVTPLFQYNIDISVLPTNGWALFRDCK
ncbi:hypothetical protein F4859DRAFT_524641 [Xylaria cf. heliscus]|nr:hypothetical protein F4859DRAFT_524641 [Xylaria cf. heliscus]